MEEDRSTINSRRWIPLRAAARGRSGARRWLASGLRALERAGNRTRAVYAITPAGREQFRRLLTEAWRTPARTLPSTLYTAITFLDGLPTDAVMSAIEQQIAALEQALAQWDEAEAIKARYGDPVGIQAPLFQNGRDHLLADLKLLKAIRERLPHLPQATWQIPPMDEWRRWQDASLPGMMRDEKEPGSEEGNR